MAGFSPLPRQSATRFAHCARLAMRVSMRSGSEAEKNGLHAADTKHLISDQGSQFREEYRAWCMERGVRPRFGAIGRHGSIALVERFIRSLKAEGLRRLITIPLSAAEMAEELAIFVEWYNEHRPHRGLGGATPNEIFFGRPRARDAPRFEVRGTYPTHDVELRAEAGTVVEL